MVDDLDGELNEGDVDVRKSPKKEEKYKQGRRRRFPPKMKERNKEGEG